MRDNVLWCKLGNIAFFLSCNGTAVCFAKAVVVEVRRYGEEMCVARSQAKHILRNLDKFHHITFDFQKVRMVGQGFVDQVFRVYQSQHPEIMMDYINANEDVEFMIKCGLATAGLIKNRKESH